MVTVSVPGKIHLMGEHAVVYGYPAFLVAVNRRLTVTVEEESGSDHKIECVASTGYVRHILSCIEKEQGIRLPPLSITITSQFPSGYHLGSSAAVAAATIGAVTYYVKKIWNPIAINKLAYETEKFIHGNPSGADNTVVTFGGVVWFRKELPFLNSIWQLPTRPHANIDHFFLINTGKPLQSTKEMVEFVAFEVATSSETMEAAMRENEKQTRRIACAVKVGDEKELMSSIKAGEQTLETMGVVSKEAKSYIRLIEESGGCAKILGGGGKDGAVGYLLAYHPNSAAIEKIASSLHFPIEKITLGEEGIRLEKK